MKQNSLFNDLRSFCDIGDLTLRLRMLSVLFSVDNLFLTTARLKIVTPHLGRMGLNGPNWVDRSGRCIEQ